MIYTANITIPANTPANSPTLQRIKISLGLIYKIELQFPPGCGGLAHVVINDGGYQVWPSTPSTDFATDDYTISFEDIYLKPSSPSEMQIYGYNEDETYEHIIQVRLGVASTKIFMARYLPTITYDYFMEMLRKKEIEDQKKRKGKITKSFSFFASKEE